MNAVHRNKKYNCDHCCKSYKWKKDLEDHVKIVHREWKLKCNFCDYRAPIRKLLRRHISEKHTTKQLKRQQKALQAAQEVLKF